MIDFLGVVDMYGNHISQQVGGLGTRTKYFWLSPFATVWNLTYLPLFGHPTRS